MLNTFKLFRQALAMVLGPPANDAERNANRVGYVVQGITTFVAGAAGAFIGYEASQIFYEVINSGTAFEAVKYYNDVKPIVDGSLTFIGAAAGAPIGYNGGRWVR